MTSVLLPSSHVPLPHFPRMLSMNVYEYPTGLPPRSKQVLLLEVWKSLKLGPFIFFHTIVQTLCGVQTGSSQARGHMSCAFGHGRTQNPGCPHDRR